ncbi:hypothetical protein [Streptomyces mobaraensis]|uniref:hypothetical protein n=1 Tax=Streptomyces mobaraensis TaxID=35621 RepID=UPI0033EB655B
MFQRITTPALGLIVASTAVLGPALPAGADDGHRHGDGAHGTGEHRTGRPVGP